MPLQAFSQSATNYVNRTSSRNVLVSTTPELQGIDIAEYHGAISAHVVAGTNIFSDIAASWRDVFGGQSKSYKKQLEQINTNMIDELKDEASKRGANALVGLRIDHDQISGQNKGMFMVTASATAVRTASPSGAEADGPQQKEGPVTARELEVEVQTVRMLEEHRNGKLLFSENTWRFLIENRVSDFTGAVQNKLAQILRKGSQLDRDARHLGHGQDYFLSIPDETSKDQLYQMATDDERAVKEWAIDVLKEGNMLDFDRIESMLEQGFYNKQKPALGVLATVDKPYYEPADLERMRTLKPRIQNGFEKRGTVLEVEKRGMFSSGTEEVWQIQEGARNPMNREYCEKTGLNIYGFSRKDTTPDAAAQALETKIQALKRRFAGTSTLG